MPLPENPIHTPVSTPTPPLYATAFDRKSRNPLNKSVLAWVVFDGAAKGVRTAVRGLLASTQPLEFRP